MKVHTELSPSALRIAEVAKTFVQEVGYNGFSFEHIAQAVGMRKASVHHHFASKSELGVAVVQRYTREFDNALRRIQSTIQSAPQRLQAYADLFETTFQDNQHLCVCGMLGAESNSLDPAVREEVRYFFQINRSWLSEVIDQGQARGSLHSTQSAGDLAESLLALLEGSMLVGRHLSKPMGPRRMLDVFVSGLLV